MVDGNLQKKSRSVFRKWPTISKVACIVDRLVAVAAAAEAEAKRPAEKASNLASIVPQLWALTCCLSDIHWKELRGEVSVS